LKDDQHNRVDTDNFAVTVFEPLLALWTHLVRPAKTRSELIINLLYLNKLHFLSITIRDISSFHGFISQMTQNSSETVPAIDTHVLQHIKLIMGTELQSVFIQHFIDGVPPQLEELQEATIHRDIAKIRQKAHRLKGESLQMGASQMAMTCQLLENMAKAENITDELKYHEYLEKLKIAFSSVKILLQPKNDHEN